ncbi:ceramidase domain-containing protein [Umezawaea sp.]|uniref:ceramidase domain-containing protein n=1 Tax=Umezawaea sp. TaxID=1955258 RepID=UPI002ED50B3B
MNDYVDTYCERLAPGLWGEPLNAFSNLAFLLAAAVLWFRYRPVERSMRALVVLLALIGVGSLSFHTAATELTRVFDVLFIALFVFFYVVCFGRWFWGLSWPKAWLFAPGLALLGAVLLPVSLLVPAGSGSYLAAGVALAGLAVALRFSGPEGARHHWRAFALAAVVFAVSLTLRTVDLSACPGLPSGTHYLWHLLNAVVLYLVAREALVRVSPPR